MSFDSDWPIFFDATGRILSKLPEVYHKEKSVIYYYSLVTKNPFKRTKDDDGIIVLCEFLTNNHTVPSIKNFLLRFNYRLIFLLLIILIIIINYFLNTYFYDNKYNIIYLLFYFYFFRFKKLTNINIRRIEVDGSHAMINSVIESFGLTNKISFLRDCWDNVKNETSSNLIVHICQRHVKKSMIQKFKQIYKNRKNFTEILKKFKVWMNGFLNATTLESFHRRVMEMLILTSARHLSKGIEKVIKDLEIPTNQSGMFYLNFLIKI